MEFTKRIETIGSYVKRDSVVADVGTDHGYLPIFLVIKGISKKVYAMDLRKAPLMKAKENIEKTKTEDSIETILSDGLLAIGNRRIDTVVIAGMGGMLINKILLEAEDILKKVDSLVLSPHLDAEQVRKTVHKLGYNIVQEDFIKDEGKHYPILICNRGIEISSYSELEYKYGKIIKSEAKEVYCEFLGNKINKIDIIIKNLCKSNTKTSVFRMQELEKEKNEIKEVMKWLG